MNAALKYDDSYSGKSYILVIRNALHVPNMKNHLIPPFILREAGIVVNDTPKMQIVDPDVRDHSLYFKDGGIRIPLTLNGIFSCFDTTKPTSQIMNDCRDVYILTPCKWNPHDTAYQNNEEQMLNYKGEMTDPKHCQRIILSDIPDSADIADASFIGSVETSAITSLLNKETEEPNTQMFDVVPSEANEIASVLAGINPILDDRILHNRLSDRANLRKYQMAVGSTTGSCNSIF